VAHIYVIMTIINNCKWEYKYSYHNPVIFDFRWDNKCIYFTMVCEDIFTFVISIIKNKWETKRFIQKFGHTISNCMRHKW